MSIKDTVENLFEDYRGKFVYRGASSFPVIDASVMRTLDNIPYLREPGVVMISQPEVCIEGVAGFLEGFDADLGFRGYLDDQLIEDASQLVKFSGQLCYMSFGPNRTKNADAGKYLGHIKESGHGSVIEHPNFSFLFYGIDRAVTHEIVRHRAGAAYSQQSQRFVDAKTLRFVEPLEYQRDPVLHERFMNWIKQSRDEYEARTDRLVQLQEAGTEIMTAEARTDLRKKVRQAARRCLPNETEAPMVISLNVRAERHVFEMRVAPTADTSIRIPFFRAFLCMALVDPYLFEDYEVITLPDGTHGLTTKYRKV